ncbi:THUMP domain-containing class I SAM-dependent RNA methyltransferase [Nitrospira sp. Kam-Ns4a]
MADHPPTRPVTGDQTFFAPCPRGLEAALCVELAELGARAIRPAPGGVGFRGPFQLCYRVNLESRLASRVLWQVAKGRYRREADLYGAAVALPWPDWFSACRTIKVTVTAIRCPLRSLDFVTLRIKDAICDRFVRDTGVRPSVDTSRPDIRVDLFLEESTFVLSLDTSGEALFKRGLRRAVGEAPLRENLAAGILRLTGWVPGQPLLDPMCGAGTFLLEAALIAGNVPPGLGRRFAFEVLRPFDAEAWRALCAAAGARRVTPAGGRLFGCDRDERALAAAGANLEAAGFADTVSLRCANILELEPPAETGILIANPPYGVRMGDEAGLAAFYPRLGDVLKRRFHGWRAYLFTADLRLPKLIGLRPARRLPLYNGALECRLYEFILVRGSMRRAGAV